MRIEKDFNFRNPNYTDIFKIRAERLSAIREDPNLLNMLKVHYRSNPADFISDWGCTFDPRNPERELPALVPFVLFPKQIEWINWCLYHWKSQKPGLVEKTRTVGMSWLSMAFACTMCLFNEGIVVGFGSRKQEYVDQTGSLKALFPKARLFLRYLPKEFLNGFNPKNDAPFMRINFNSTGSQILGESGDGIGRGDRASMYFVDEAAFLERPQLTDASLSETTNCRIDISTPNGLGNPFAEKRHSGKIDVFTFHWRDDPRRDQAWYDNKCLTLDPVTVAQELDINYSASVENILIPSAWVQASIDAHKKLNIEISGDKIAALDVADTGKDLNALCIRDGILIDSIEEWSGKESDIYQTALLAFNKCDLKGCKKLYYDADGLGAGIRGDTRIINITRPNKIDVIAFRGSGEVYRPTHELIEGRKNKDFFANAKAQAWWMLRQRFEKTYMALNKGLTYDPDELISINPDIKDLSKLLLELSQPTYSINQVGKILIDKAPDSVKSPNMADSVMMAYAPIRSSGLNINIDSFR